jgi:hypothetical protein
MKIFLIIFGLICLAVLSSGVVPYLILKGDDVSNGYLYSVNRDRR